MIRLFPKGQGPDIKLKAKKVKVEWNCRRCGADLWKHFYATEGIYGTCQCCGTPNNRT